MAKIEFNDYVGRFGKRYSWSCENYTYEIILNSLSPSMQANVWGGVNRNIRMQVGPKDFINASASVYRVNKGTGEVEKIFYTFKWISFSEFAHPNLTLFDRWDDPRINRVWSVLKGMVTIDDGYIKDKEIVFEEIDLPPWKPTVEKNYKKS